MKSFRLHPRSVLLILLVLLTAGIAAGLYLRSHADQERLRHDSHSIEAMLSESAPSSP